MGLSSHKIGLHTVRFFALLLLLGSPAQAGVGVGKYIADDITSPVTTPALTPFLVGAGLTLALFATKAEISHPFQESITRRRPLDKYAKAGDWFGKMYPNIIYAGGALVSGLLGHERGYTRAEEMALASAYSGLVTSLLKITFQEGRPNNPVDRKSFPSGHATTAFAFAGIVGAEHAWYFAVPAYVLAANTGYSRINDNKHYLHDVVGGATVGISYALGIYYVRKARAGGAAEPMAFTILPADDMSGALLAASRRF